MKFVKCLLRLVRTAVYFRRKFVVDCFHYGLDDFTEIQTKGMRFEVVRFEDETTPTTKF